MINVFLTRIADLQVSLRWTQGRLESRRWCVPRKSGNFPLAVSIQVITNTSFVGLKRLLLIDAVTIANMVLIYRPVWFALYNITHSLLPNWLSDCVGWPHVILQLKVRSIEKRNRSVIGSF